MLKPILIKVPDIVNSSSTFSCSHSKDLMDENLDINRSTPNPRLPKSVFAEHYKEVEERKRQQEHWFRRGVLYVGDALIHNRISYGIKRVAVGFKDMAAWATRATIYTSFRYGFVPIANLTWNRHSAKVPKFLWGNVASPVLDIALNNVENFQNSKIQSVLSKIGKTTSYILWDNVISKTCVAIAKPAANIISKSLFLCMEGAMPSTPMQAVKFMDNKFARNAARIAYYGSYAAGLTLGALWYASGAGLGLASTATFLLAPSIAAAANRAVMFFATKGNSENKTGWIGLKTWAVSKFNGPFVSMLKSEDAFNFKIIKDPNTGTPIDYYIGSAKNTLREFVAKRLSFLQDTKSVYSLVDHTIEVAKKRQEGLGFERRLTIGDVYALALQEQHKAEGQNTGAQIAYPSGRPTISLNKFLKDIFKQINPPGYSDLRSNKKKEIYLDQLVSLLAPKVVERLNVKTDATVLDQATKNKISNLFTCSDCKNPNLIEIPKLEQAVWQPTLPGLLIKLGQMVGGFANTAGAGITTVGHLIRAINQVFLDPNEPYKPLGLSNLRKIKGDLDSAMKEANSGEEAFLKIFKLTHSFIDTLESGVKPFAAALGEAAIDAIIMHTPFVAQNQMESVNSETNLRFVYRLESEQDQSFTKEYKESALKLVEEFWQERGDQIIEDDFKITREQRRWYHWFLASLLYPKRAAGALNSSISQLAAGDPQAQMLLDGLRIYFKQSLPTMLETSFLNLKNKLSQSEEFLRGNIAKSNKR